MRRILKRKAQTGRNVPETRNLGDDLSISNAIRRIKKNPKDPENLVNQALRLHPFTQIARGLSEGISRVGGALGNKSFQRENARRDSTYEAQKKALQKKKAGGKVTKAKAKPASKAKTKAKSTTSKKKK